VDIKRLGEVIIRTQFEAPEEILFLAARGKQKHIDIGSAFALAESLANLDAFHPRHHPIQDGQTWSVRGVEKAQGLQSVRNNRHVITPLREIGLEQPTGNGVVLGDQNSLRVRARSLSIESLFNCLSDSRTT
jgi:hypothetical protein